MKQPFRKLLLLGLISFFSIQLLCTLVNRSKWPFCAYNVFNGNLPDEMHFSRIVLEKNTGELIEVDSGSIVPIEFFRSYSALNKQLVLNPDSTEKEILAKQLLDRLNNDPWGKFDQIRASAPKKESERFVRFALIRYKVDFNDYVYGKEWDKDQYTILYQYPAP